MCWDNNKFHHGFHFASGKKLRSLSMYIELFSSFPYPSTSHVGLPYCHFGAPGLFKCRLHCRWLSINSAWFYTKAYIYDKNINCDIHICMFQQMTYLIFKDITRKVRKILKLPLPIHWMYMYISPCVYISFDSFGQKTASLKWQYMWKQILNSGEICPP